MGWNIMVGNSAKGLILLIFLIILTVADARVLRSGPGDSLDLQTNGVNSRLEILSSGEIDAKTQFRLLDSVVFPVKTTAERDALTLVDGLSVWNTDNDQMNIYDLTGATWRVLLDTDSIIPRNKVATGTANYVLINDGSGNLSEEQFLDKTRGGAGADMSSVTFPGTGTIVTETGTSVLTNKDIDGGTASNTSRITLGKDTTVNLDALTDKAGTIWYDTTLGAVVFNDGTDNIELASGGGGGGSAESVHTVSANYTITDIDGYTTIVVDDTTSDRTITLPTVSDNTDRVIRIKNDSTQKNKVIVDAEGGQFIEGMLTVDLDYKAAYLELQSDGTEWKIVSTSIGSYLKNYIIVSTGTNYTNARTVVRPYRDINGNWFATFNLRGTASGGGIQNGFITLPGLTFNNNGQQALTYSTSGSSGSVAQYAESNSGASTIVVQSSSVTFILIVSGNVELLSKPTFVE